MSYFFLDGYEDMETYNPGEQPHDRPYIKLNANESSYPPSPAVRAALSNVQAKSLAYYEDPYNKDIRKAIGDVYGFPMEQVFVGNGANEVIAFIMQSFFREGFAIASNDITYDFYRTYAKTFRLKYRKIPVKADFSADVEAFRDCGCDIIIANPNNPTGRALPVSDMETIVAKDPRRLVIVDEAYVDFGGESCLPLVNKYPNIIVVETYSKSRNMAGARIGFCIARRELIDDMRNVKFCVSPFNLNVLSQAIGIAAVQDQKYYKDCISKVVSARDWFVDQLKDMGFETVPAVTNFVLFKTSDIIPAEFLTAKLKEKGILVRYYGFEPRIRDYVRVTIGTRPQMELVADSIRSIIADYAAEGRTKAAS